MVLQTVCAAEVVVTPPGVVGVAVDVAATTGLGAWYAVPTTTWNDLPWPLTALTAASG